ncbi:MAG: tetratricopeptide repeat protein [Verrucomicrobiales bacterium]|nr:tetratricopeptide repeat protein [Verrucomicrobiales bacterium]
MLTTRNPVQPRLMRIAAALVAAISFTGCTPPGPKALLDGERLLQQGKPVDAARRFRTAVEFLPSNAQAWNHLGLAYHLARQPAEAAEAYQQAARLDRNLAPVFYNLGCLRLETDDPGRASDALRTHVGLDPKSIDGWRKLGQAQLRLLQWDQAERAFLAALKLSPQDPEALNGLGVSYQQRRRARDAWQCFSQITTRHPDFAPAWYNLGMVAHQAGARSQAIAALTRYRQLAPAASASLGLDSLLRQWVAIEAAANAPSTPNLAPPAEKTAAPAPVSPTQETNRFLPATRPPAQRVAVPSPTAPPDTNASPSSSPIQARPPPRRAAAEPAGPPTNADLAAKTTPTPTGQASPSSPQKTASPPPTIPVPVTGATSSTTAAAPPASPTAAATPKEAPLEVVDLAPSTQVATQVLDEPVASRAANTQGVTPPSTSSPPVIRPIAARRPDPDPAAQRRGFWDRANPAKWFATDKEADATPAPEPEKDGDRWRWVKPASWFKSDNPNPKTEPSTPTASGQITPAASSPAVPPTPSSTSPGSSPAGTTVAAEPPRRQLAEARPRATPPSRPAPAPAPVREFKRYKYGHPAAPEPGDRTAARPVLSEAMQEHRRGRLEPAAELYRQVLRLDPASTEAHEYLAAIHLQKGEVSSALASGELALALQPESPTARLNFALALEQGDFPADAAVEAERLVEKNPNDTQAHLLLGNLYSQHLADTDRARRHYSKVIDLEPNHPQSVAIRRWLASHPPAEAR